MIFAAGRGERMRPLTDATAKPLLEVGGKRLIEWHLEKLGAAGINRVVINTSWRAGQFPAALGDGSRWNLQIDYIDEGPVALETGGGMLNALPLLGSEPFLAISGDVWCDADFAALPTEPTGLAHLLMVDNPPHHPDGDFALDAQGVLQLSGSPKLTFSGIGVFRRELLHDWKPAATGTGASIPPPSFKLRDMLQPAMARHAVTGTRHHGLWTDVGTPTRLAWIETRLATPLQGDAGFADS